MTPFTHYRNLRHMLYFFIFLTLFNSCTEDLPVEEAQDIYKDEIISFLKTQEGVADDKLQELTDRINFQNVKPYTLNNNRQVLIAELDQPLSIQRTGEMANVVIWMDNGKVTSLNILVFGAEFLHTSSADETIVSFLNNKAKSTNGKYSVYNVFQSLIFFNEYKNNDRIVNGTVRNKFTKTGGGKTDGCTDWYLVTTYYSGGSSSQVWQYLYTTCDCGDQMRTTAIKCGGGGTSTGTIPANPTAGDRYSYTDLDGTYRLMEYRCLDGACGYITIYTQLPVATIQANPNSYPFIPLDPMSNEVVFDIDGLGYIYNGFYPAWEGELGRSNVLCGFYTFTDTGEGITAEISGLGGTAVHAPSGTAVPFMWGAMCVTFGSSSNAHNSVQGTEVFNTAWNYTMNEAEAWLNQQSSPASAVALSAFVLTNLEINLNMVANGYAVFSTGACLGSVYYSKARYCTN